MRLKALTPCSDLLFPNQPNNPTQIRDISAAMAPGKMMPPPPRPRLPNSSIKATFGSPGAMELDAAEKKILRDTVFPPDFSKKVDTKKVNLEVLKQYVSSTLQHKTHSH
jgi:hypothetical protein